MKRKKPAAKPRAPWSVKKAADRVLSPDEQWAAGIRERVLTDCHPWQRAAVLDPSRFITLLVGRGGGKTTTDRARGIIKLTSIRKAKLVYIATTRPQAEELLWGPLKDSIESYGLTDDFTFNESKLKCTCKRTGATLRLVGADDKREIEKLRGQPFDEVQIDEGASHDPKLLENLLDRIIGPRLGERHGCIVLAGTPGHILRGPFYDHTRPGAVDPETKRPLHRPWADRDKPEFANWDDWSSHAWTLKDVFELPNSKELYTALWNLWVEDLKIKARKGWSDSHPIWMREYLGRWAADDTDTVFKYQPHVQLEGPIGPDGRQLVIAFNEWDPERIGPLGLAKLPSDRTDWHFVFAFDKGWADQFACNGYAFSPTDPTRSIYHFFAFERTQVYAELLSQLLIGEEATKSKDHSKMAGLIGAIGCWPDGMIADADEAFLAELANVYGIKIAKAQKAMDYKFGAIELVNGDLVEGRIKVLKDHPGGRRSPLALQLGELQWKEDDFGRRKEDKAQANHSTDTLVYGRKLIALMFENGTVEEPKAPTSGPNPAAAAAAAAVQLELARGEPDELAGFLTDPEYVDSWGNQ